MRSQFLNPNDEFYWLDFSLLYGIIFHKRYYAWEISSVLGYQIMSANNYGNYVKFNKIGIVFEANFHLTTEVIGISPFLTSSVNTLGYSFGIGTKILIGKVGYNKKQYEKIKGGIGYPIIKHK